MSDPKNCKTVCANLIIGKFCNIAAAQKHLQPKEAFANIRHTRQDCQTSPFQTRLSSTFRGQTAFTSKVKNEKLIFYMVRGNTMTPMNNRFTQPGLTARSGKLLWCKSRTVLCCGDVFKHLLNKRWGCATVTTGVVVVVAHVHGLNLRIVDES